MANRGEKLLVIEVLFAEVIVTVRELSQGKVPRPSQYIASLLVYAVLGGLAGLGGEYADLAGAFGGVVLLAVLLNSEAHYKVLESLSTSVTNPNTATLAAYFGSPLDKSTGPASATAGGTQPGTLNPSGYIYPVGNVKQSRGFIPGQHPGIDFAVPMRTPVRAAKGGIVGRAAWFDGYGNCVDISHDATFTTRYAHLDSFTVIPGQSVKQGDVIGYSNNTGNSTGPHLHFEIQRNGVAVDPAPYLQGATQPV